MKNKKTADSVLLGITFIWGTTFVVVQNAISFLQPHSFNFIRFSIAAFILGIWMIVFQRDKLPNFKGKIWISGLFMGFWLFIGYAFQTLGLQYTTSAKAAFITGLSVVLVPIIALFILKNKPSIQVMIGVIIAVSGLYLLTKSGSNSLNIGDLLVLICAFGFAMHIIITGKYAKQYPVLLLTVIQISEVAVLSGISALFFEDWEKIIQPDIIFKGEVLTALLITGVFATALAFLGMTYFQRYTTPAHTALIFAMEPVFAAITAFFVQGEMMGGRGIVGSCLIFAGMILAELPLGKNQGKTSLKEETG